MAQGPNYGLQGGSVWAVSDEGTLTIATGGSINVESGGVINVASGGSITGNGVNLTAPVFNTMTLGGTVLRAAYGTVGLTSGLGTIATGLTRVFAASAAGILGEAPNIGSVHWVLMDYSLAASGSIILRAGSANGQFGANATVSWLAMGT